jgi:hypothetical protein
MLSLAYDRKHRVLRVTISGIFASQDMDEVDLTVIEFVARQGQVRCIFDYTEVEAFAVPESLMARRAQQPLIVREQRVIVASRVAGGEAARVYVRYQREAGQREAAIVDNLEDAYLLLRLRNPRFEAVER